jgi:hypothetical protein
MAEWAMYSVALPGWSAETAFQFAGASLADSESPQVALPAAQALLGSPAAQASTDSVATMAEWAMYSVALPGWSAGSGCHPAEG